MTLRRFATASLKEIQFDAFQYLRHKTIFSDNLNSSDAKYTTMKTTCTCAFTKTMHTSGCLLSTSRHNCQNRPQRVNTAVNVNLFAKIFSVTQCGIFGIVAASFALQYQYEQSGGKWIRYETTGQRTVTSVKQVVKVI